MTDNSPDVNGLKFSMKVITSGCDVKEVLADDTPYDDGAELKPENKDQIHTTFLKLFKKIEEASRHFTTDGARGDYKHITRKHVSDVMGAYGKHLKANDNASTTFGEEYHRILSNVASTMESWT